MKNKSTNQQNTFVSEEEKTIDWSDLQSEFQKNFGEEVYSSWLKSITLVREYNDYLVLGVPTRFFRDWIVSRYLDKILEQVKSSKLSLNRIEFKIIEDNKNNSDLITKTDEINKVTAIKDSILNYNTTNAIISGGVTTLDDVRTIVAMNKSKINGMIIGKALYEDSIKLSEAIHECS